MIMKKWTFLAVAGLLAGAAPVFTGCIDNDEPEGISILRGAKAELLKAKAAVEQANAQWVLAQAEYVAAQTRWQLAQAEYEENRAKLLALEVEIQAARNEAEKAQLAQQIEQIRQQMEENALAHEAEMIKLQGLKAQAQANYEVLLKQIEIAKALGSEDGVVSIASLEAKVKKAYAILYGGTYTEQVIDILYAGGSHQEGGSTTNPETGVVDSWYEITINGETYQYKYETYTVCASEDEYKALLNAGVKNLSLSLDAKLYEAEKALYNAELDKAQGNQFDEDDNGQSFIDLLTAKKNLAEYEVSVAQETLDALNAFISGDPASTDWKAELEKIAEEIDALEDKIDDANLAYEDQKNSPEYIEKWQKVYGVFSFGSNANKNDKEKYSPNGDFTGTENEYEDLENSQNVTLVANGTKKDIIDAENALEEKLPEVKLTMPATDKIEVNAYLVDEIGLPEEISFEEVKDYTYTEVPTEAKPYPVSDGAIENNIKTMDGYLEDIENYGLLTENELAQAKYELEDKKELAEDKEEDFNADKEAWSIALNARNGNFVAVDDEGAFKKVTAKYSENYKALSTAINTYNTTYDGIYDAAYQAKYDELYAAKELDLVDEAFVNINGAPSSFNPATAQAEWAKFNGYDNQMDMLESVVKQAVSSTGDQQAKDVADVVRLVTNYVEKELSDKDLVADFEEQAGNAGTAAITADKDGKLAKADGAVNQAVLKMDVTPLYSAVAAYTNVAKVPYGYVMADEVGADDIVNQLVGVKGDSGYAIGEFKTTNKDGHYVIGNTDIDDAEVDAVLKASYKSDADQAKAALNQTSRDAFGIEFGTWQVATSVPSIEEINKKIEADPSLDLSADFGSLGVYYAALSEVEAFEAKIESNDDVVALNTAITTMKEDYIATFNKNYETGFSAELKAIADAEAADKEAVAALEKADAELEASNVELAKLQAQLDGRNAVMEAIADAITDSFGDVYDYDVDDEGQLTGDETEYEWNKNSVDKFLKSLEEAAVKQELNVAAKKQALAVAEVALQKAQEGKYDIVAEKTRLRDIAKAEFDAANEAYGQALANLQTALEIMADNAAE